MPQEERRRRTDEESRCIGGLIALEMSPFVEDQDDQVEEDAAQEEKLREKFQEDAVIMTEISEQKMRKIKKRGKRVYR